jgi:hypothetical protein
MVVEFLNLVILYGQPHSSALMNGYLSRFWKDKEGI